MKRKIALILIGSMLATACCGCGSVKTLSEEEKNTIVIWHDKEENVAAILEQELETLAPDVNIELEYKSSLTDALKMVGNDPNSAPDMYMFAHDKIGVYAEMGILSPITEFVSLENLEDKFVDVTLDAANYKGEIYQLPIYYETLLFMYNKAYMPEDEVPSTTEELYNYMEEHTAGGHYGFVEQHSTAYYSAGWIHGFGGYIMNSDAKAGLNLPETEQALEYHKKFVELMPAESEYSTISTLFQEGKAHSTIGGPWLVSTARENGIELGIAPMPIVDETGIPISPYLGVQGVQILKYAAENKTEAVQKVVDALMNPEVGIELASASGCAPALEECYESESVASDDVVKAMRETADSAVPMPNCPEMDVMWTVTADLLVNINMSGKDVAESCDEAQASAIDLINKMQ